MKNIEPLSNPETLIDKAETLGLRPVAIVQPIPVAPSNQSTPHEPPLATVIEKPVDMKPVGFGRYLTVVSVINIACFVLPTLAAIVLMLVFGVGYIYLLMPVAIIAVILSTLISLQLVIGIPLYLKKHNPSKKLKRFLMINLGLAIYSLVQALPVLAYAGLLLYALSGTH